MRRSRKNNQKRTFIFGFTLVELLVVIAIIALLMSILMPALARVRKQAKATLCQARLKQWGYCFSMYANDNDNYYPRGWSDAPLPQVPEAYWMAAFRKYYGDEGDLRLCPAATKLGTELNPNQWGGGNGTFTAWGLFGENDLDNIGKPWSMWPYVAVGDYGSYGWNSYICNMPSEYNGKPVNEWAEPDKYNWRKAYMKGSGNVPLLGDHQWLDCWPLTGDEPPDYEGLEWWSVDQMGRICINRHEGFVNWVFADYTVRKIGLKQLWRLKWSRVFDITDGPVTWPDWMKGLKEYK